MNEALRQAMADATMTERELARICDVDEKTVVRWVSNEGRLPHQKHRWTASAALGVDESVLWPEGLRAAVKTGPDREIVAAYPYRSAVPKSLWRRLITTASVEMTFGGYTNYFLWLEQANFSVALRRKAAEGCRIRFLVGDPEAEVTRERERLEGVALTVSTRIRVTLGELERLRDVDGIEARLGDQHIALSVFRFDSDMIVTPHLAHLVGHDSPTLHLRRRQDDGLFDRFLQHGNTLWDSGRPAWPST